MSGGIGSVFLGDRSHHISLRHSTFNPSSPPTSPPARPATIDPVLSLQLRIRWLEALVSGLKPTGSPSNTKSKGGELQTTADLLRRAEEIQSKLNEALESNEGCKKFIKSYDQFAHLLTPAAALSPTGSSAAPSYDTLSDAEFETLLAELEPDIRAADRDLREIDTLDGRGVTSAGKLPEHEALKSRLQQLVDAQSQDLALYNSLEGRISNILQTYASHVTTLSELFVVWNDLLAEAEDRVEQLQKVQDERNLLEFNEGE
ncbi:hypothetical protein FRB99_003470 [Tulasnella sp. 403]|nr:hypothetical protein FRB99_003470 [Tulasnella sp. 403]